ncbi:hypothetical protein J6590_058892 [Homalodisca vitripennis]|nr:hypothetical protein J6590_058892 [Homalodisca vitripennis]
MQYGESTFYRPTIYHIHYWNCPAIKWAVLCCSTQRIRRKLCIGNLAERVSPGGVRREQSSGGCIIHHRCQAVHRSYDGQLGWSHTGLISLCSVFTFSEFPNKCSSDDRVLYNLLFQGNKENFGGEVLMETRCAVSIDRKHCYSKRAEEPTQAEWHPDVYCKQIRIVNCVANSVGQLLARHEEQCRTCRAVVSETWRAVSDSRMSIVSRSVS